MTPKMVRDIKLSKKVFLTIINLFIDVSIILSTKVNLNHL